VTDGNRAGSSWYAAFRMYMVVFVAQLPPTPTAIWHCAGPPPGLNVPAGSSTSFASNMHKDFTTTSVLSSASSNW
jgi:hypothetical protein